MKTFSSRDKTQKGIERHIELYSKDEEACTRPVDDKICLFCESPALPSSCLCNICEVQEQARLYTAAA